MFETLTWWVLVELIGLAVWPVAFRFFRNLPDRGYAFLKPLGLLLIAYPFWLLTTFGFLNNTQGAIALVAVLAAAVSWGVFGKSTGKREWEGATAREEQGIESPPPPLYSSSPLDWLREHLTLVLATEFVFTIAFFAWVVVRAYMPEIQSTEKPMEFAFLNGILRSEHFPPQDPWLSGYGISYYYFGYIIIAMLTMLSGIHSSIAFNLAIALLFALASTGAFGLAFDLITSSSQTKNGLFRRFFFALFAPILMVLIGNLEGLFEALHARGLGSAEFWEWLDVKGLAQAPVTGVFAPDDNWWWWRASRVVHDVARGQTQEVIDEFPQFSFLLGDMHPHVLALPFVLLALAVALNLLRETSAVIGNVQFSTRREDWTGVLRYMARFAPVALVVGALPFLNFWDILPYGFIVVVGFAIARYRAGNGWDGGAMRDTLAFVVGIGVMSLLLYLPFFIAFQSQAGGLLPVLFVKTQLHQYLLMFGIFVFIFVALLARVVYEHRDRPRSEWFTRAGPFLSAILGFPLVVAGLMLILLTVSPALQDQARAAFPDAPASLVANALSAYWGPLVSDPWLALLLVAILVTALILLRNYAIYLKGLDTSMTFVLLLVLTGFLLTFGVEFVYLRDVFGTRMNTVFKFYFQTWTLFSVAAAFAVYYLSTRLGGLARGVWFAGLAVLLGASLVYPAEAIPNRADDFRKTATLDGIQWIRDANPSDYAGIQWLAEHAPRDARILESTGRQYSYDDRMSMATGLPTVLGWIGHEEQWRGSARLYKNDAAGIDRAADVARIYQTVDPKETLTLIDKYAINFVVVGETERSVYGLNKSQIDKFSKVLALAFENGDLRIYARSQ